MSYVKVSKGNYIGVYIIECSKIMAIIILMSSSSCVSELKIGPMMRGWIIYPGKTQFPQENPASMGQEAQESGGPKNGVQMFRTMAMHVGRLLSQITFQNGLQNLKLTTISDETFSSCDSNLQCTRPNYSRVVKI